MKNVLKILGGLTLVLALLLGIGSLLLHIFLPPEKAKALVLKQLTDRLKREVQIDRVSIGVLSGLSVSNLRISESPDFSKGTFLSSELFSLRISLPPLLMKKIVVRQLILKHPEVTIVRNADGKTFNFSDLTAAATTSAPSTAPAPSAKGEPPFLLLVSRAELQKAVLHFIDRSPAQESLDINPLNLSIHNVSLVSPFSIRASMRVVRQKIETMLELSGDANLATQSFHLKSCSLSSRDSSITLTGKATELRSGHPNVDLKLDIKGFNPASLQPLLPMPAALKNSGPLTGKGSIKGDQNDMGFTGFFDLTKPQIIYGNQFNKPAKLPFTVSMKGAVKDLQTLTLSGLQIVL